MLYCNVMITDFSPLGSGIDCFTVQTQKVWTVMWNSPALEYKCIVIDYEVLGENLLSNLV